MSQHRLLYTWFTLVLVLSASNAQERFTRLFPNLPTDRIGDVIFVDSTTGYFTNDAGSIYGSTDCGNTWALRTHHQGVPISLIRFLDQSLGFAASPHGGLHAGRTNCLVSTDGGQWWSDADISLADANDFLPISRTVLLKANDTGIQRLDNFYGQWTSTYTLPVHIFDDVPGSYGSTHQLCTLPGGDIVAVVSYWNVRGALRLTDSVSLLIHSLDAGASWDTLWQGSPLVFRTVAFASDSTGWMGGEHEAVMKTTDGGLTWTTQHIDTLVTANVRKIIALDMSRVVAVTGTGTFLRTTDGGSTWSRTVIENSWEQPVTIAFPTRSIGFYGGSELFRTLDGGATWAPVNNSLHQTASHMEFITHLLGWVSTDKGLYASTDGGTSWSLRNDFSSNPAIMHFDFLDSLNAWGVGYKSLMRTTDGGHAWTTTNLDPAIEYVRGVSFFNKDLGIVFEVRENGTYYCSNLVTTDGGATWEKRTITEREFMPSWFKTQFTDPEHLWFANQYGLWLSRDTARTWQLCDSMTAYYNPVFDMLDSLRGFCDLSRTAFGYTADAGKTWKFTQKPYPNQSLDMAVIDPFTHSIPPVILSGDEGTLVESREWYGVMAKDTYTLDRLPNISVVRSGNTANVWVLGSTFQILHASYLITGVQSPASNRPYAFRLEQNYPNPFNPSTAIPYELAATSRVRLVVYDILGREVATLASGIVNAGHQTVAFQSAGLATGVYLYRLEAHPLEGHESAGFTFVRKMLLVR
jgi:photosystem II stability/assembly factor-like uncharacterized protein